ncbi:importin subunit alpha-2-like isoform X2 [Stegodyphus dumicola]|uniref:importin subunit alpha-2-like isoform X2 n=1 Tax=Stegodyphus dumicola TaxID=202533 RepID=UPI0015AFCEB9|nr:importin subunit alpha-2-like isoform X2 [Stegodyphus dumicola]
MQEMDIHSVKNLRDIRRQDIRLLQKASRGEFVKQKRSELCEVEQSIQDVSLNQFKEYVKELKKKQPSLYVLRNIRTSCRSEELIEAFFKIGGSLQNLIRVLIGNDAQKQLEAVACLTNLACGSHRFTHKIARNAGAYLVSFIDGGSSFLQSQSAWAAGNIAADCCECFVVLKMQGLLPVLLKTIDCSTEHVFQSAVFALKVCTKYGDHEIINVASSDLPKKLLSFLLQGDITRSIKMDLAFTLVNLLFLAVIHNLEIININVAETILKCLYNSVHEEVDLPVATPLLRCLGYLTSSEQICKYLCQHLEFHVVTTSVLKSECSHLKKELFWILTNLLDVQDLTDDRALLPVLESVTVFLNPLNSAALPH